MPLRLIYVSAFSWALPPTQFILVQVLAELFKAAIMVVSDIGIRLPQLLGNFAESISLKEIQPQSFSLLPSQSL